MNQNNNVRNIYIKCTGTYNKNIKKNFNKTNDIKEENLTDKNNIIFIKNNNLIGQNHSREKIKSIKNSKPKDRLQNKKLAIYYNKNDKKKLMNDNMNYLIDNIEKDNVMTNAVNIHNINLINSMNNITVYDSYNDNKIPHLKSDIMKYPMKMSCQTYNKNKDFSIKGNYSMDLNLNDKEEKKNIIVNKKRTAFENKSNNIDNLELFNTINNKFKNNSLSKKKNPFQELNYKKLSNNFKSCAKFNKGNNYSNFNKQDNKININNINNIYSNQELGSTREIAYQGENSQIKNRNNAVNKSISKDNTNTTNKTDFSNFNNYSNYTSSVGEEEINGNKNKNIFDKKDNKNNKKNLINVNKLDSFKMNNSNNKKNNMNASINFSNYKSSDNNSNIKNSSNSSSNIFSLLSNKNKENYNKSLLDIENLNKIKKNINKEKLYKTKSKDNVKNNKKKLVKHKSLRCNMKTKSEEKKNKKNKDNKNTENKEITKKIKIFSSFLNENEKNINDNYKKNGLGNLYVKDSNNYSNNANTYNNSNCSKFFYSTFSSDNGLHNLIQNPIKKPIIYPNKINYNKEIQNLIKLSISNTQNDNGNTNDNGNNIFKNTNNDINLFERIEVNKKNYQDLSKKVNKSQINNKSSENMIIDTRNETSNLCPKKTLKNSWIDNTDQINIFPKNMDYYCYLSNYKEKKDQSMDNTEILARKKSAPKKNIENIIYNKKPLYHTKNGRKSLEEKILSPDTKQKQKDFTEYHIKNNEPNCITEEMIENDNIKNKNFEEEITINFNFKEMDVTDNMSEKFLNINKKMIMNHKTFLLKSPQSTVYKKPGINVINNSNSMMINGKDSFNNNIPLNSNKIENEKDIFIDSSKKKSRKKYLNIKLNRLIEQKEFSNENKKAKKNKININNINYDKEDLLPKLKEFNEKQTINSYKRMKNNLTNKENNKPNKENNKSKDFIINSEQFSVTKINKKIPCNNSFMKKYCCYYIDYNPDKKNNCFITKIRLNKYNLIINEIPIKKICYFSKKRKRFVKILPISEECYFKKDIIIYKNYNEDENLIINGELYDNKKENDEINNIKFNNPQSSFVSLNSIENNYFEISFGKKLNKSLINLNNENPKNNLNNNDMLLNKVILPEKNIEEKNIINNLFNNENKFLNNNINISPSKKYSENKNIRNSNNENYLKKTEKGLKLLEKIADQRIIPITQKIKTIYINNNNQNNEGIKNNQNKNKNEQYNNKYNKYSNIKLNSGGRHKLNPNSNSNSNKKNNDKNSSNKKKSNNIYTKIKYDFIELLNIITINNYDIILNKISCLILNNNIVTIDNISQLLTNQNIFAEVVINKAIKEKKFIKIYSKLCKDLFISLMSIIDNYNDDMDIFDKITKDKSLKLILKNKIIEKINQFNFSPEPTFGMRDKKIFERDPFYCDLKFQFNGLFYFVGELLEVKIVSQKTGFEILEILYKRYIKGNSNINTNLINDLNLEGIEILLSKMKIIVYVKNNPEHIQRYNKFIKNYLNNIFKKRNKNDLPKYLFYKLFNLIENQKNEKKINKFKTFVGPKFKKSEINLISDNDRNEYLKLKNNSNSFTNLDNKYTTINNGNNNLKNISKYNIGNNMIEMIKKDIEKFLYDSNKNQIKYDLLTEINKKYNEELNIKKTMYIWEIFYYYIEVCIDIINTEEKIYIANEYIENIINNFAIDLPNEGWEMLHYKLISLFLNINEICTDNIYMHQIMGNLLFMLINNKLFYIKDLNNFLNKDNEVIINIAKVVKYTIIYADKDAKKYHNDFKQTKLFIGNKIFYDIVTIPLNKKYLSII